MNYNMPSGMLRKLKVTGMVANSYHELVRPKPVVCQRVIVPRLHLEVVSINQDLIVNVKLCSFFHIKSASLVVEGCEDITDIVVHYSNSIESFFCSWWREFIVVVTTYSAQIEATETSVQKEIVGTSGCSMISKFCDWQPCSPMVLPIMVVDAEILLECLDYLFTEFIYLQVVGSGNVQVDIMLSVHLLEKVRGKLQTMIRGNMP